MPVEEPQDITPYGQLAAAAREIMPTPMREAVEAPRFLQTHLDEAVARDVGRWTEPRFGMGGAEGHTTPRAEYNGEDLPEVEATFRRRFPTVDFEPLRQHYIDTRRAEFRARSLDELTRVHRAQGGDAMDQTEYFNERLPFVGGGVQIAQIGRTWRSAERIKEGQGALADYENVARFLSRAQRENDRSSWEKVIDTVTGIPGFALEFGATGGIYNVGSQTARRMLTRAAGHRVASSVAGRLAIPAVTSAAGAAFQTAANPTRVAAETLRRTMPDVGPGGPEGITIQDRGTFLENLPAGTLDTFIEMWSERAGGSLPVLGTQVRRLPGTQRLQAMGEGLAARWAGSGPGRTTERLRSLLGTSAGTRQVSRELAGQFGFHGVLGEAFEERVGEVMRGATGLTRDRDGNRSYGTTGDLLAGRFEEAGEQLAIEGLAFTIYGVGHHGMASIIARQRGLPAAAVPGIEQRLAQPPAFVGQGQQTQQAGAPATQQQAQPQGVSPVHTPLTQPVAQQPATVTDQSGPGTPTSGAEQLPGWALGHGVVEVPATVPTPSARAATLTQGFGGQAGATGEAGISHIVQPVQGPIREVWQLQNDLAAIKHELDTRGLANQDRIDDIERGFETRLKVDGPAVAQQFLQIVRSNYQLTPTGETGAASTPQDTTRTTPLRGNAQAAPTARQQVATMEQAHLDALRQSQDAERSVRALQKDVSAGLNKRAELKQAKAKQVAARKSMVALERQLDAARVAADQESRAIASPGSQIAPAAPAPQVAIPPAETAATPQKGQNKGLAGRLEGIRARQAGLGTLQTPQQALTTSPTEQLPQELRDKLTDTFRVLAAGGMEAQDLGGLRDRVVDVMHNEGVAAASRFLDVHLESMIRGRQKLPPGQAAATAQDRMQELERRITSTVAQIQKAIEHDLSHVRQVAEKAGHSQRAAQALAGEVASDGLRAGEAQGDSEASAQGIVGPGTSDATPTVNTGSPAAPGTGATAGRERARGAETVIEGPGMEPISPEGRIVLRWLIDQTKPTAIRKGILKLASALGERGGMFDTGEPATQTVREALEEKEEKPKMMFHRGAGPGGTGANVPIPGQVAAQGAAAIPAANTIKDAVLTVFAPSARGEYAAVGAGILREQLAILARKRGIAEAALKRAEKFFETWIVDAPDAAERTIRFQTIMDAIEGGAIDSLPADQQEYARTMRTLIDERSAGLASRGLVGNFIENYIGHLWAKPNSKLTPEQIGAIFQARRPLAGGEGFRKKRSIPTYSDGLALGLEPVDWNPARLTLLNLREMDKSIMAHDVVQELTDRGLWRYFRIGATAPEGWRVVDDKVAKVFAPPTAAVKEFFDKQQMEGLEDFARSLGIDLERTMRGPAGASLGGKVLTRFGTPEEVLAHEIGHEIDRKHNLSAWANDTQLADELRQLADLRASGQVSADYQAYLRSAEEKVANLIAAYIHAPELLKQVAPHSFARLDAFLASQPRLAPLRDIKPSLELGEREQLLRLAGPMLVGHYYTPEPIARLLNNHLTPGLRGNAAFDVVREFSNILNQVQLGFSVFHATFILADTTISGAALGLQQISRGEFLKGTGTLIGSAPGIALIRAFVHGNKALQEYYRPGSQGAEIAAAVDNLVRGGGRAHMDEFYGGDHLTRFRKALKDVRGGTYSRGGAALYHALPALTETLSWPIMSYLVPRMKLGVMFQLAQHELERAGQNATVDQQLAALGRAWDSVENRLGQLTYDNLFISRTLKDVLMVGMRSVGWNIGTMRELGGGIKDIPASIRGVLRGEGISPRTAYTIALPMVTAFYGALLQMLLTGKPPEEPKDYFFPKTGRRRPDGSAERLSLPTYMRDIAALANRADEGPTRIVSNAWTMAKHKLNPGVAIVAEMLNNENFYGRAIYDPQDRATTQALDLARHLFTAFEPMAVRGARRESEQGNASVLMGAGNFFGITPAPSYIVHSAQEQRAAEQMRQHQPTPLERRRREQHPDQELFGTFDSMYQAAGTALRGDMPAEQRRAVEAWRLDVARVARREAPAGGNPFLAMDALPQDLQRQVLSQLSSAAGHVADRRPARQTGERIDHYESRIQEWQQRQDRAERFLALTGLDRGQLQALMLEANQMQRQHRQIEGARPQPQRGTLQRIGRVVR